MYETILLGKSKVMERVREQARTLAPLPWHVRVEGPTGTGKNVAARLLHQLSSRARGRFLVCNLGLLPDNLESSELVGHCRGAFTGATEDRPGAFELAHNGTCFLDEVGTASPKAQQILLRLVDEGVSCRLGECRDRTVDVRLIFATNVDLEAGVRNGTFRDDLLGRMKFLVLKMPALAEHPEDIPELVEHILEVKCREAKIRVPPLGAEAMGRLMAFSWPRNVRDLEGAIEHYVAFGNLPDMITRAARLIDWRERLDEVLRQHGGKKAPAAEELGISRETLYAELRRRRA